MVHARVEDEEEECVSPYAQADIVCYTAVEASFADCRESSQGQPDCKEWQSLNRRDEHDCRLPENKTIVPFL